MKSKLKIGITLGDPNGIGPEVVIKALSKSEIFECCDAVIYGSREIVTQAQDLSGLKAAFETVDIEGFNTADLKPGVNDKSAGAASLSYIEAATKAALSGEIDAIVTAPISKEATHLAGSTYPGHTEMLRELTGADNAVMMFDGGNFRVALVTIHCALSDVPGLITRDSVFSVIKTAQTALVKQFRIKNPRIGVCGLNPHAGESGAFGDEEILAIIPALEDARELKMDIEGPLPADTLFYHANKGRWDMVIAMYHDQGLIPFKMLSFDTGVNVTLGLPIIRTSPDHGTAYDIAWKGQADPSSMTAAIKLAAKLSMSN